MNKSQSFWGKRKTGYDLFLLHPFFANIFPLHLPLPLPLTDTLSPSSCSSLLFSSWGKIKPHPIASTVSSPFTLFHLTLFIFLLLSSFPCHFRYLLFRTIFHREKRFSPFSLLDLMLSFLSPLLTIYLYFSFVFSPFKISLSLFF